MAKGNVLFINNNGAESYADPARPPTRIGKTSGRPPTEFSKAGDLVGKVSFTLNIIYNFELYRNNV